MIIDTLTLLNETTIRCLNETDEKKIIGTFTELGVKILRASFGFVWMSTKNQEFELVYRSRRLPYTPLSPKKDGLNAKVLKSFKPDFVSTVEKRKDKYNVSRYMKSFVIIPIAYKHNIYGNIIICFKRPEKFSKEKRILCTLIGSNIAQAITIIHSREIFKENEEYHRKMKEEELRTEFITDAMHEIRTPLAVIKGTLDLTMKPSRIISQSAALKSIDEEMRHLMEILSELSMLTSKDSHVERAIQTKKIKLLPFIRTISKRWKILANKRDIVIQVKKIPAVSILADESYLNKLFTNIIKNAITYGRDNGHIFISGTIQGDKVIIDIQDDGIGISRDDLVHIFERFYRADKSRSHLKDDNLTGLGLAITKWIAEAHGGEVIADSILGKGSTFSVSLPFV